MTSLAAANYADKVSTITDVALSAGSVVTFPFPAELGLYDFVVTGEHQLSLNGEIYTVPEFQLLVGHTGTVPLLRAVLPAAVGAGKTISLRVALRTKANDKKPLPFGSRIATNGTSLAQQNTEAVDLSADRISHSSRGWMPWLRFYSKGAVQHPVWIDYSVIPGWEPSGTAGATRNFQGLNFGVSGQFAWQILARLPYIFTNYGDQFDAVIGDGGTNDIAGSTPKEEIQFIREHIALAHVEAGKPYVMLTILARGTTPWPAGSTRHKAQWVNRRTREFCARFRNIHFYDWNKDWVDGANADGVPRTGFSNDETHFAPPGGESVGLGMWNYFSPLLPAGQPRVVAANDAYNGTDNLFGNILTNGLCTGTGGASGTGSTGNVATGMRVERSSGTTITVANTKEARADGRGDYQVMTYTLGGTAEELFYFRTSTANTTHNSAGQWVSASCEVITNASDAIRGLTLELIDMNPGGSATVLASSDLEPFDNGSGNVTWATRSRDGRAETPPIQLASDSTVVRWRLAQRILGSGSVAPVIKAGAVDFRRVDDPRDTQL